LQVATLKELDPIAMAALDQVRQKAEPKLKAALARHGVSSPEQLPPEVARKIFQDIFIQTAAENFPSAQLDALKHGFTAFQHPRFGAAFKKVKAQLDMPSDAFAMASGPEAAIVLAGFGLPVAPFDRKKPQILATPSSVIDEVVECFSRFNTAFVGYSPCDVSFYMLITDCVQTMRPQIESRPELRDVKRLLERTSIDLRGPFPAFKHGIVLIPREPGDAISTVILHNQNPHEGSVCLYAGWTVNGVRDGAPNGGFSPVPLQFLLAVLQDPQIAMWIWRPTGARMMLN
jgi:hypothetical protein